MNEPLPPLIVEATKKASIVWVEVAPTPPRAMWCTWSADAVCVVCGPAEQPDPGLGDVEKCSVTCRGDHGGRIVTFSATVDKLVPGTETWTEVAAALAAKRLNAVGDTQQRWAEHNAIYRLVPTAAMTAGDQLPDTALAAEMVPTPATTATRQPFRLHRVKRRKKT